MKIKVKVLRIAINRMLDHVEATTGGEVDIDEDYYWFVPKDRLYVPESEPTGLTLGSLEDDWAAANALVEPSRAPIGYDLVWVSALLRALGDTAI